MTGINGTPRTLRNRNVSLIDKLKAKQKELKASFNLAKRSKGNKKNVLEIQTDKENLPHRVSSSGKQKLFRFSSSTPGNMQIERKTPKSILKKRKIIDDNTEVDVKIAREKLRSMSINNNNYVGARNVNNNRQQSTDSIQVGDFRESVSSDVFVTPSKELDFSEELSVSEISISGSSTEKEDLPEKASVQVKKSVSFAPGVSLSERRLKDPGNSRMLRSSVGSKETLKIVPKNSNNARYLRPLHDGRRYDELEEGHGRPLLGYDWIAGFLDSDPRVAYLSSDYLENLKEFRRVNKEACVSKESEDQPIEPPRTPSPTFSEPEHTCIHNYTVNNRLFAVPLNINQKGESICPICEKSRKLPTSYSPGFVRVSIPHQTIKPHYQPKPHRRKSFDPSDTYALSEHVLAGWENARPSQLPTARAVDLRQASGKQKSKQATTLAEAEKLAHNTKQILREARLNSFNLMTARRRASESLLDTSHALRYNLQKLEKQGPTRRLPNSTQYPLL